MGNAGNRTIGTESTDRGPELIEDGHCFGCGQKNPIGLQLQFEALDDGVRATFTAAPQYQGFAGMLHGGLAATLLDEAIAWAIEKRYGWGVTGEFQMRHRRPVPIGRPLEIRGRVLRKRLQMVEAEAQIRDDAGAVLVEGRAKFMLAQQTGGMVQ